MSTVICPIVGAHFRPPAKGLLQSLPLHHTLSLRPEPTNEYDPQAIAVWLLTSTLTPELGPDLATYCTGFGYALADILAQPEWHLGYIPAQANAKDGPSGTHARLALSNLGDAPWTCTLAFAPDGRPAISIQAEGAVQP